MLYLLHPPLDRLIASILLSQGRIRLFIYLQRKISWNLVYSNSLKRKISLNLLYSNSLRIDLLPRSLNLILPRVWSHLCQWWKKNYFSEIGHFRDFIFDIIHVKVLSHTNPMMYFMYHLKEQVRRYFDFSFLSW